MYMSCQQVAVLLTSGIRMWIPGSSVLLYLPNLSTTKAVFSGTILDGQCTDRVKPTHERAEQCAGGMILWRLDEQNTVADALLQRMRACMASLHQNRT